MSKRSSKSSSSSTQTATTTPNVPSWLQGPAQSYYSNISSLMNNQPTAIGATGNQTAAFNGAQNLSGLNQGISQALSGTQGLMGYTPSSVTAGQLRDTDMSAYMNPYTSAVIDAGISDLDRARQMSISGGQGAATRAGAYGGSRHGVMDAETNRGFIDQVGSLTAGLRDAGWRSALGAAQFDIGNRMNADQFNVNAGLQGANFRLGAANQLGGLGAMQDANMRGNLSMQAELGEQERDIAQENDPNQQRAQWLSQIARLLGIDPSNFIGQTVNQTGKSSGKQSSSGFSIGWSPSGGLSIGG